MFQKQSTVIDSINKMGGGPGTGTPNPPEEDKKPKPENKKYSCFLDCGGGGGPGGPSGPSKRS